MAYEVYIPESAQSFVFPDAESYLGAKEWFDSTQADEMARFCREHDIERSGHWVFGAMLAWALEV